MSELHKSFGGLQLRTNSNPDHITIPLTYFERFEGDTKQECEDKGWEYIRKMSHGHRHMYIREFPQAEDEYDMDRQCRTKFMCQVRLGVYDEQ